MLLLLCLAVYLPGQGMIGRGLAPVDRDESRFAQASRQMYESGDYVVPRVQDRPRLNKPPLIYWAQCAAVATFGDPAEVGGEPAPDGNIWVFRIPSLLAAILTVLATWRLGCSMFDPRAAWLGSALLAASPVFVWEAHQARADQLLVLTIAAAQGCLWKVWKSSRDETKAASGSWLWPIGFWFVMAASIMTKGPIGPMIAVLTVVSLCVIARDARWLPRLRPLVGLVIVAAFVVPWIVAVGQRVGWDRYLSTVYEETIGRTATAKEGHWGPPGYHLVLLCVLFWPGSLLTGLAIERAFRMGLRRIRTDGPTPPPPRRGLAQRLPLLRPRRDAELFCLAWIIPSWMVFECVGTKLPHYTMPLYPAIALLSARAVFAAQTGRLVGLGRLGTRLGLVIWILIGLALGAIPLLGIATQSADSAEGMVLYRYGMIALLGATFLMMNAGAAIWWPEKLGSAGSPTRLRRHYIGAQRDGVIAACIVAALAVGVMLPRAGGLRLSSRVVRILGAEGWSDRPCAAVGYHEDSLVFLTRGRVDRIDEDRLALWLADNPRGVVVLPVDMLASHPELEQLQPASARRLGGLNYSIGRRVELGVTVAASGGGSLIHDD